MMHIESCSSESVFLQRKTEKVLKGFLFNVLVL